jgi:hypothetical protein
MEPNYLQNIISKHPYLFFIDDKTNKPLALTVNIDLIQNNKELFSKWIRNKQNENRIQEIIDTYIEKNKINEYNSSLMVLKDRIEIFYSNLFNIDDYTIIKSSIEFFKYYNISSKTKKRKQELDINKKIISDYSVKYNIDLFGSFKLIFDCHVSETSEMSESEISASPIYDNYLIEFKNISTNRTILIKKIDAELSNALKNYKEYISSKNISNQIGKYFKKWNMLSNIEKDERILSFVSFYCNKHSLYENNNMKEFIKESIESKKLLVKDIKWNVSYGTIVDINIKYKDGKFILPVPIKKKIILRFQDKDINDLILNGIINNNNLVDIKIKIKKTSEIKRLNKAEESIIDARFSEFSKLSFSK